MKISSLLQRRARTDSFSLLVLLPTRLVRADVSAGSRPTIIDLWETPAPSGESPPVLAEAALALGPVKGTRVLILASSVWTQLLQVPPSKVAGLSPAELENALSFEAEALSGINPFDSALGHQASTATSPGDRGYWVTQMSATELSQIESSFARQGATLLGVLHPGGLPRKASPQAPADGAWQRIELWNDIAFAIDAPEAAPVRVHALMTPPGRSGWEAEADQWFASLSSSSPREVLAADRQQLTQVQGTGLSLDDDSSLRSWLLGWAVELGSEAMHVPVVRPPPKPVSDQRRAAIGVSLAVAAVTLCVGHAWWLKQRQQSLTAELAKSEAPEKQLAALKAQVTGLEHDIEGVRRQGAALRALRADWTISITRERRRHSTLLKILSDITPSELTINALDESAGQLRVSGIALQPHFEPFAAGLAAGVDPLGWRYEPPRRSALNLSSDGGPWLLDWSLRLMTNQLSFTNISSLASAPQAPSDIAAASKPAPPPGPRPGSASQPRSSRSTR